ncbi:MAG: ABC transporter substrate-binding protein [Gemmatimonadetes bacterium]|nr:ABC transporter substrate-binding protein [Gemmatimonadota bacterium]
MRPRPSADALMVRGDGLAPRYPSARSLLGFAVLAAALVGSSCSGEEAQLDADHARDGSGAAPAETDTLSTTAIFFTDAAGREHRLEAPAQRVISLVPSATETIRAIGAEDALVGVTDYDDGEWTGSLPSVGGGLEPNMESLVALHPDVVIRFHGEQDPRTPARLDDLGIPHVAVRPVALGDVYETNRIVGQLLGRPRVADSLSSTIREGLADLSQSVADLPRQRVVYMLGGSPPWVSGPDTYISDILTLAGGDNVFGDLTSPYQAVSPEELRAREIDVVLVTRAGSYDASLTPNARIEVVGDALQVPGPDVVEAARSMAEVIHGRPVH